MTMPPSLRAARSAPSAASAQHVAGGNPERRHSAANLNVRHCERSAATQKGTTPQQTPTQNPISSHANPLYFAHHPTICKTTLPAHHKACYDPRRINSHDERDTAMTRDKGLAATMMRAMAWVSYVSHCEPRKLLRVNYAVCLAFAFGCVAPNAKAESVPECEQIDSSGLKIFECTEPLDIRYTKPYVPGSTLQYFESKDHGTTAQRFVIAYNAYEQQRRAQAIADGYPDPGLIVTSFAGCTESFVITSGPQSVDVDHPFYEYDFGSNGSCSFPTKWLLPGGGEVPLGEPAASNIHVLCPKRSTMVGSLALIGRTPPFKCARKIEKPLVCEAEVKFGNPISARTSMKTQTEALLPVSGEFGRFVRLNYAFPASVPNSTVGWYWQPEYLRSLVVHSAGDSGVSVPRVVLHKGAEMVIFRPTGTNWAPEIDMNDRLTGQIQPVDATHSLNISAGVWKPSVLRGLSFNCLAIALS
jgi:hypothetical protein